MFIIIMHCPIRYTQSDTHSTDTHTISVWSYYDPAKMGQCSNFTSEYTESNIDIDELRYLGRLDKCQVLNKLQLYTHDVLTYSVFNRCKTGNTITQQKCVNRVNEKA